MIVQPGYRLAIKIVAMQSSAQFGQLIVKGVIEQKS